MAEFLILTQGSMSVLEYEHKLNELLRYALGVVSTKADKCEKLIEGLWPIIQMVVTMTTYPMLRALAQAADRLLKSMNTSGRR